MLGVRTGYSPLKPHYTWDIVCLGFSLSHISLDLEKMFRGSTNGSSSSDEEIHGGVRGDHGYVTQSEFVGLRHLVRDGLGRYERRLQTHDANFNQINANMERMTEAINNRARQRAPSRSSRTRSTSRSTQAHHGRHEPRQERQHDSRSDAHERPPPIVEQPHDLHANNANAHQEQPHQNDDRRARIPSPPPPRRDRHDPLANDNGVLGANDFGEQGRHPRHPPRPRHQNHDNANNVEHPVPQQELPPQHAPRQELPHDRHQHQRSESSDNESSQHNGDGLNRRRRGRAFPRGAHGDNYDDLTNVRFDIPKFYGTSDPEAYFSWVLKVDKIFRVQRFSDKKKVALASMEFEEYALLWWEQLQDARVANHQQPIDTWVEMK